MSDTIKTILYIVLGLISIATVGWGGREYLQNYVEQEQFQAKCAEWKQDFGNLRAEVRLERYQIRLAWLQQQIVYYDQTFGLNCQRCDANAKRIYWEFKREFDALQLSIQKIMRGGG